MAKKKKKDSTKTELSKAGSLWSIAFFLATLGNFFLFSLTVMLFLFSPLRVGLYRESLISFFAGFLFIFIILITTRMRKIRTIVHEMKHAAVVILTGNKLKKIVANKDDGFVEYQMYQDRLHFAPVISLAPYFFPFFSLPVLIASMLVKEGSIVVPALLLGMSLSADICMGIAEIHPEQSDFKSIFGGFWLSKFYLVGFYLFWPLFVFLWVRVGNSGLVTGFEILGELILNIISRS